MATKPDRSIAGTLQRVVLLATSRNDIVLALMLMAIIFMMILPLPTWMIDVLIGMNITLSAILLMVAMYLPSPLAFASFPSVLLITTLFRLGISVATTRLILLQADAGHIVYTFGNFVVGGNLVVGLVVFLILTIVQFIVITKGAERVAEVAARFSLDSMPGKQMSIDSDMRAGTINMEEARRRRRLVEKESQLYGAMDGAMKFVKGDAIAGIIIVAVNLIGGLLIGTLQRDMSGAEAAKTYSILTIGDGLIAQIPALFIAVCAGMIVTRVQSGENKPSNIGRDIGAQVLAQPKALMIAGVVAAFMGIIPGMPTTIFVILSVLVGGVGYLLWLMPRRPATEGDAAGGEGEPAPANADGSLPAISSAKDSAEFAPTVPLQVQLSAHLEGSLAPALLNQQLLELRKALYLDLGVPFPGIRLRYDAALPEETYTISIAEVPVAQGTLRPGWLLARERPVHLENLNIGYETGKQFLPLIPAVWVKAEARKEMADVGISNMDANQILTCHLGHVLRKYAGEFIGIQETRFLLSSMEANFPELVKEAGRILPVMKIADILRRLVSEDVSIRNLRAILEALIEWGQKEKDSVLLAEYVRGALKRYISHKYSAERNLLPAYLLAPAVEETLRNAIRQTSAGSYLALDPAVSKKLLQSIKRAIGDLTDAMSKPVLLTSMDIRRYLRKLIEQDLFELPVLSYQELTQDINIQPLAKVEL